jgi:peptidylprolyl isomerase
MKRLTLALAALPLLAASPAPEKPALAPSEIVAAAPAGDWVAIAPADLLVMDLAADAQGRARRVVIQLMPAPFLQGWIGNIRKLAAAHWWDGLSVNRVQDNYVAQWGDADGEDKARAKPLPAGLMLPSEREYSIRLEALFPAHDAKQISTPADVEKWVTPDQKFAASLPRMADAYAPSVFHHRGWPLAGDMDRYWPVHCYGAVGVGRGMSPDTGSGAELYAVIGHAPRHLDRNIAVIGRVIEGIEHLSALPRGSEALGFYKTPQERTAITSIRMGTDVKDLPRYQYLSTESQSFARYADARANRRDAFFITPAGGADICNIPIPIRRAKD